jgi:hypothetical protein
MFPAAKERLVAFPFRNSKPNAKRDEARRVIGRERLHGHEAKEARRREIFKRSGGRCENILPDGERCPNEITWTTMEWSHNRHAANKDDSKAGGIASCRPCHRDKHSGGKAVPKKPGRVMSRAEALKYWRGLVCFCSGSKKSESPFCDGCLAALSPQLRMDLQESTNREWLEAVANAELELMALSSVEAG